MKKSLLGVSLFTVGILYSILVAVLLVIFVLTGTSPWLAVVISLVVFALQMILGPVLTDLSMRFFYKAKFDHQLPAYLDEFIQKVCKEQNMQVPRIGYIDDGAPNAFTYGRTKNDARVILTRGLFELLEEDEVKAVVAHELGHARHYDMLIMTAVQLVPLFFYALFQICRIGERSGGKSGGSNGNANGVLGIVAVLSFLVYVITQYLILWLSRSREYYADYFSIITTQAPNSLASALVKIGFGLSARDSHKEKISQSIGKNSALGIMDTKSSQSMAVSMMDGNSQVSKENIVKAMRWEMWNTWAKWYELNSTHPLISKRILEISKYSEEYGQEPFITFDEKKPHSFVPGFMVSGALAVLPFICLIGSVVAVYFALKNADNGNVSLLIPGLLGAAGMVFSYLKCLYRHPGKYEKKKIVDLIGEVNVSNMKAVPVIIEGKLIGRGDPGCIFSENYVLQDETGIMLVNYKQPLKILDKVFALFKAKKNLDKKAVVKGWYRRNPTPHVDMFTYEVDGESKMLYRYYVGLGFRAVVLIGFIVVSFLHFTI